MTTKSKKKNLQKSFTTRKQVRNSIKRIDESVIFKKSEASVGL